MKKLIYSVAMLAATMIGFTSCEEEEEKVDVRDQAIGNYNVKINYYISDGKSWDNSGIDPDTDTGVASIDGNNIKLTIDGDDFKLVKIAEASNGFTFDVEDAVCTEDGITYTLKGYNGFELVSKKDGTSTKFSGGFFSDTKTLKFYMEMPKDQFSAMLSEAFAEDEEFMAPFLALAEVDPVAAIDAAAEIEAILSKLSLILEITCKKK